MKAILVDRRNARRLGVPAGAIIDYDKALTDMQRQYDSLHKPLTAEQSNKVQQEIESACETAYRIRKEVNDAMGIETIRY